MLALSGRFRGLVAAAVIFASSAAWALEFRHASRMGGVPDGALAFLLLWTIMMTGMMLPGAVPAILLFSSIAESRRAVGVQPAMSLVVFILVYLVTWSGVGVVTYLLSGFVEWIGEGRFLDGRWHPVVTGLMLVIAGLYQFTRWKGSCLAHCRSPLLVLMHTWQDGAIGAARMGFAHGRYCVGCCWALMGVLLGMGAMDLAWMGVLALAITTEKVSRIGPQVRAAIGAVLIVMGSLIGGGAVMLPAGM